MNKSVIKKYKKEFDYWLDGGTILFKAEGPNFKTREWRLELPFWEEHIVYIKNDKLVQYRKAEAEGEIVQYKLYDNYEFINCETTDRVFEQQSAEDYRIKPKEPAFKEGDKLLSKGKHALEYGIDIDLWEPKQDEWCWFWDCEHDVPALSKFILQDKTIGINKKYKTTSGWHKYCEPFIGTLPSEILKEDK